MPNISAVLIVKDEAKGLPACLDALRQVVDEIIIADTGSTDGTLAVAREYTPHCHQIPWENDFAAARNRAIAEAAGPWILIVDADEVLENPADARSRLDDFVQFQPEGTTGTLQQVSRTGTGPAGETVSVETVRFFPKEHYTYTGVVHEQLIPCSDHHRGSASTGLAVRHSGYEAAPDSPDHKSVRNLPLLEKALAAEPENEYYHYQLGKARYALEQYGDAAQAFERALALIEFGGDRPRGNDGKPVSREVLTTLVTSLAYAYANTGRLSDAEQLLSEHIQLGHHGTQWADFYHVCGYIALMLGDIERAKAGYSESMKCGRIREDVAGTGSHASAYHLGLLAEAEQDPIAALGHYGDSLQFKSDYAPTLDRIVDFMVENQFGVAPAIQTHANRDAFHATCLRKLKAYLDAGEKEKADFLVTVAGLLVATNKKFAGDLLEKCQEIRRPYGT